MWIVKLIKPPTVNDFRADFFPRKVRYKSDALELQAEVVHKGGEAVIEKGDETSSQARPKRHESRSG